MQNINLEEIKEQLLPTISILIRTTGRLETLRTTINSILMQKYKKYEIIIVEDGGDSVQELIKNDYKEFAKYFRYIPMYSKVGRCKAGNIALRNAKGSYCIFLDDDDIFYADHLESLVGNLKHGEIVYSLAHEVGFSIKNDTKYFTYPYLLQKCYQQNYLYDFNFLPINTVLFPREAFEKYGGFDEELEVLEDWVLWVKYSVHYRFHCTDEITCAYLTPYFLSEFLKRKQLLKKNFYAAKLKVTNIFLQSGTFPLKLGSLSRFWKKLVTFLIIIKTRLDTYFNSHYQKKIEPGNINIT